MSDSYKINKFNGVSNTIIIVTHELREILRLPRRASGSALSADRQTLDVFVIVKVLFWIPRQLIIVKIRNEIEFDVIVSSLVKT